MYIIKVISQLRLTVGGCKIWYRIVALLLVHLVLEHAHVVVEGRDVEDPDDDVGQVVGVEHQALLAVLNQLVVVLLLIFTNQTNWKEQAVNLGYGWT